MERGSKSATEIAENKNWSVGWMVLMGAAVLNAVAAWTVFVYLCVSVAMGWPIHHAC